MSDKIYHTRKNMMWTDVKKAMSKVKKFRKQGFYLEVEQQDGRAYDVNYAAISNLYSPYRKKKPDAYYTTRLWGPVKP